MKMAGQKSILFFNSNKAWGGGEKWHFEMALNLHKLGYNVYLFCHQKGQLIREAEHAGIICSAIKVHNLSFLNFFKILRFSTWLKNKQIDRIILNLPADMKFAGIAAKIAKVPRIIYRRGSAIPIKNSWINRAMFHSVVSDILVNSEETRKTILANNRSLIDQDKIQLIYNGIKLDEYDTRSCMPFYQKNKGELVIGNAARMVPQKGQEDLLELAVMLKKEGIPFKMLIVGEGKLKYKLMNKSIQMGLKDCVQFPGFITNIKAFMKSIDVFVLTSRWEGFGYVLAEAMASSKPIVAYNVSSNPELVVHGKTGYLVETGKVDQLYAKTLELMSKPSLQKQFGANGRNRVEEKFDFDKNKQEFIEWLEV
jgi:glycosyltransferase involved in cell wall biosynthesis